MKDLVDVKSKKLSFKIFLTYIMETPLIQQFARLMPLCLRVKRMFFLSVWAKSNVHTVYRSWASFIHEAHQKAFEQWFVQTSVQAKLTADSVVKV